jgi:hypothetical protein
VSIALHSTAITQRRTMCGAPAPTLNTHHLPTVLLNDSNAVSRWIRAFTNAEITPDNHCNKSLLRKQNGHVRIRQQRPQASSAQQRTDRRKNPRFHCRSVGCCLDATQV